MPRTETEKKPTGWEKLGREGSATGAEAGWDAEKHLHYHVLADTSIVYHERPQGVNVHTGKEAGEPGFVPQGLIPNPFGFGLVDPAGWAGRIAERQAEASVVEGQALTPEQQAQFDAVATKSQAALDAATKKEAV